MSLSSILADYLKEEEKERDPKRLFISDIGKCPRQVAYRLMETEKDYESEQEKINKSIMFSLALKIEGDLIGAMKELGTLVAEQDDVAMPDRTNWGGRFDIIADYDGGRRVIEVKTKYPGAFNYDLATRYIWEHHQGRAYDHYCRTFYGLEKEPILAYFDRGGQNTPQEVPVAVKWASTCQEMDTLDLTRDALPELPDRLGKVLSLRSWNKKVVLEPDGRCKQPYCKYTGVCEQDMGTSIMAERENEKAQWKMKKAVRGHEDEVASFMSLLAIKAMEGK